MKHLQKGLLIALVLLLTGCHTLYRPIITQGSKQALEASSQIKKKMNKEQVASIMGTPLNVAPFDDDIWEYWFIQSKGEKIKEKKGIRLHFSNNRLESINPIS